MINGTAGTGKREAQKVDAEQFRLLVNSVKDYAIFLLTPEGYVASWNAGAQAIKGYTAEETIGQHFSLFYEPEAIARAWPDHELALAKTNGRFEDEGWRVRKDGTRFWASVVITPLYDETRELKGFAKVTRDLTSRVRYEDIQRSERRTNEFLAMLAHELRNPLAPMRTALDIAARSRGDPNVIQMVLDLFGKQVDYLTRMVDDLLDVGRITTGKIALKFEAVDLNGLVEERVRTFQPMFEARKQTLDLSLPGDATPTLIDTMRWSQVLSNLLANAHKFTRDGGHVYVKLRHEKTHALIEISDDGIGIESHFLSLIFEPFMQAKAVDLERASGGLGLGLTLVKRLVELHGGSVAATSAGPGLGSTFSVTIPLHHAPLRKPHIVMPSPTSEPLRVLVVDDNEDIARTMAMLVRSFGHEVEVAHDGVNALVKAASFHAQVVLLDIGLPHMNGYEVARALRTLPALRNSTLVACTGYGSESNKKNAMESGFDHYLVKPVGADRLIEIFAAAGHEDD